MAGEPRHGQHLLTMSDIATRLGTTTTGQLLVRSGIEIERLLNAMVRDSAPVTGKLPDLMFLSRVLHFDPGAQHVVMAFTDHKPANSAVLASRSVTFMCNYRGAQFAFACTKPHQSMHLGHPAIRMGAPKIMLAMQHHRNQTRAQHLPSEPDVRCELSMGVISFEGRLVDMSLDGRAYLLVDSGVPVCAGTRLPKSRIRCEEREPVVVDIEVDQVNLGVQHNGSRATRIGGRIVADRERLDKISKLFVIDLQ
jgi:c-di-GMP-binding flagellar brake protein YcgR